MIEKTPEQKRNFIDELADERDKAIEENTQLKKLLEQANKLLEQANKELERINRHSPEWIQFANQRAEQLLHHWGSANYAEQCADYADEMIKERNRRNRLDGQE